VLIENVVEQWKSQVRHTNFVDVWECEHYPDSGAGPILLGYIDLIAQIAARPLNRGNEIFYHEVSLSPNLVPKDFFSKYPKKKTLSTFRILDCGFRI
jgi:subtilase family serine protease